MATGLRLPRYSQGFFFYFSNTLCSVKSNHLTVWPTGIKALPSPVNFIIIIINGKIRNFKLK